MTKDEALKLALEALEWSYGGEPMPTKELEAMDAIRQVLAEQKGSERANKLRQATEMVLRSLKEFESDGYMVDGITLGFSNEIEALEQALAEWTPDDTAYRPDGLSQDSDQSPDATKMIDNVYIRYWVQDTMESGHWATTDSMERTTAEILMSGTYGNTFYRGEIVEQSEMPIDRGAWSDVEDATKWLDELRGDDKQCSSCGGFCGDVCERENVKSDLLNQTCCGCGRSGGYALYCGWCWDKVDEPVGYVDPSDLDRAGHDFWVSRQPSKNSVPLFVHAPDLIGLTDQEIADAVGDKIDAVYLQDFRKVIRAVLEKNHG